MSDVFVYLGGPVTGHTAEDVYDWRKYVHKRLVKHNIIAISPVRCEPIRQGHYNIENQDPRFGTPRAISAKNKFDVRRCTMMIAYLPKQPSLVIDATEDVTVFEEEGAAGTALPPGIYSRPQSYGTIIEAAWADAFGKQVLLVSDDPYVLTHPVVDAIAPWKLNTLDDACDTVIGILSAYVGGKNV
jgi:hypothetical protein